MNSHVQGSRQAAIFILSDVRSGSTLLDLCLGSHPDILSLGETHWLEAYVTEDRSIYNPIHPLVCTCGMRVSDCPFWQRVEAEIGRPLQSLELRSEFDKPKHRRTLASAIERIPRRLMRIAPGLFRYRLMQRTMAGARLTADAIALFDAACRAGDRRFCVDSSKSPFRFRAVYDREPGKTFAIVLTRDFRAVVRSKMKHGQTLESAARGWRNKFEQISALTEDVPKSRVLQVKYETLCERPSSVLGEICAFIGVNYDASMLDRSRRNRHHIGGSPSKFDESRTAITIDRSFENHFDATSSAKLRRLVSPIASTLGY